MLIGFAQRYKKKNKHVHKNRTINKVSPMEYLIVESNYLFLHRIVI